METSSSLLDRFNDWIKESVTIKLASIGFLVLILLIPASWIESLVHERQARAAEVVTEISEKWSNAQTVTGPVLMIPFTEAERIKRWEKGVQVEEVVETKRKAYFLPERLTIDSRITPQVLHRGIFDAVVYDAQLALSAQFKQPSFKKWGVPADRIHWSEAALLTGITDLRGIADHPKVQSGARSFVSEPAKSLGLSPTLQGADERTAVTVEDATTGMVTLLGAAQAEDLPLEFQIDLALKGSQSFYVVPAGKTTEATLAGPWPSPSFDGALLPASRQLDAKGFSATWKVLSFNRPFAQQWRDAEQQLNGAEFGVRLVNQADQYQKSIRTAKYAVLVIILAFTALLLVEITGKIRIHPFQYILVGAALIIYYTLLLSVSEHAGYNLAYLIASLSTTSLLALYANTFLGSQQRVWLFGALMSVFYVFIFVIIQAQDYSLLIGSIGLFLVIAVVMYFSRNIRWYKEPAGG